MDRDHREEGRSQRKGQRLRSGTVTQKRGELERWGIETRSEGDRDQEGVSRDPEKEKKRTENREIQTGGLGAKPRSPLLTFPGATLPPSLHSVRHDPHSGSFPICSSFVDFSK